MLVRVMAHPIAIGDRAAVGGERRARPREGVRHQPGARDRHSEPTQPTVEEGAIVTHALPEEIGVVAALQLCGGGGEVGFG
eukprot:1559003-Prymnesium_polylepis.1